MSGDRSVADTQGVRARFQVALRRRRLDLADDRGSLPMALLLIMVGLALAAALLPTMIVQDRATVFDGSRTDNLGAAQAGVDVVVGQIRAATTTPGGTAGNAQALPCTTTPITGSVNSVGRATYSVTVAYYTVDPIAAAANGTTATKMKCVQGYGTYDGSGSIPKFVPSYAQVISVGTTPNTTAGSAGRTITSTYVFKTTSVNVPNGQIRIYPASSASTAVAYCMDAGQAVPTIGTVLTLQTCSTSTPALSQQLFAYRTDLTLQLSSSVTSANPNGLCLDTTSGTTGPLLTDKVVFAQCAALTQAPFTTGSPPPYSQQWSFNDSGGYTASMPATKSNGSFALVPQPAAKPYYDKGYCMSAATQATGQQIGLADCNSGNTSSPTQAWIPAPSVGDGAAAAPQLINDQQFGRCLDINQANIYSTQEIAYPCKQNPLASAVEWNQKFTFDSSTGWLYTQTASGGTKYCLYSPATEGGFVRLTQCSNPGWVATLPAAQNPAATAPVAAQLVWTQPGNDTNTAYNVRYTFVDSSARCLNIIAPTDGNQWFYVTTATCTSSTAEKWNANENLGAPSLQDMTETNTTTSGN